MSIQDEFSFINQIKPTTVHHEKTLITGIGDDAAVYIPSPNQSQIICTDTLVEEIHFTSQTMSPFQIGYKALAVNISDIAAMGGNPLYYLVSIAIPSSWSEQDLIEIYAGMSELANSHRVDLIGGDTVSSKDSLMITVTVIGETEEGRQLLRSHAKSGDVVFVTGTIGDSSAGLELLLSKGRHGTFNSNEDFLIKRHQYPNPQVKIGRFLSKLKRVSLNDISDGLASESNELAEASQVTITLNANLIPLSKELVSCDSEGAIEKALFGGEDFELVGTMSMDEWESIQQDGRLQNLIKIGTVSSGKPEVLLQLENELITLEKKGYNHFKK
ncbi:thiamine-phosphate kinase [Litchfieldia salsa]|uniref:Thiamine-monophosphate kinase n=1 Tax=Litchfieldia salsa TaxID=930152 RepID=A0A1H0WRD2_9BACI|nr:thiamine-phosphate kinase [Litchfieldia salsa]SDP93202.1 thiamine-phosphate kinase [Litchfieldia salsa]